MFTLTGFGGLMVQGKAATLIGGGLFVRAEAGTGVVAGLCPLDDGFSGGTALGAVDVEARAWLGDEFCLQWDGGEGVRSR
jgi:hypothetical protein